MSVKTAEMRIAPVCLLEDMVKKKPCLGQTDGLWEQVNWEFLLVYLMNTEGIMGIKGAEGQ